MASVDLFHCLILTLFLSLFPQAFSLAASPTTSVIVPFQCSATIATCNASLYHINSGFQKEEIASLYSVDLSQVKPIKYSNREDLLISVPCSCKNISGTTGYFYDTIYKVKLSDTFSDVSNNIYSGQALSVIEEQKKNFTIGSDFPIHLPCGCVDGDSQIVVTYTVQEKDTLTDIGSLLSAKIENIETMNKKLVENPSFIVLGWVLFVPSEKNGLKKPGELCFRSILFFFVFQHDIEMLFVACWCIINLLVSNFHKNY
uniref:uncharacterized protein LOC105351459 n=1 Tax=Fragaria vesca subsp. vesca TaxID=101020 RepID=UPI0005C7F002|nr:PREDICTED: uncharacterized protein LOC105351459 [Fragaria vesca subsp. vesca]